MTDDRPEPGTVDDTGPGAVGGRSLWIAWSGHRRTSSLCKAWSIPLEVLEPRRSGSLRWAELAATTLRLLRARRPDVLFVPCPSVALTTLAVLYRPFLGYRLIVDAHNEAVRPFDRPYAFVRWLSRSILKRANTTIVSNEALAQDVRRAGGRVAVLADPLPEPDFAAPGPNIGEPVDVVVVATYRPDEPIDAILQAAATLPDVSFAITGPAGRWDRSPDSLPANVRQTGFLEDWEFWTLLANVGIVCDLTLKSDCLVCGAYEALALGKPMVLSDNPPTRELFGKAAQLTDAAPANIAEAIRRALEQREELGRGARKLRAGYAQAWRAQAEKALEVIEPRSRGRGGSRH